jgi:hypothetical protein
VTLWIATILIAASLAVPSRAASAILAVLFFVVLICRPAIDRRWNALRGRGAPAGTDQPDPTSKP